MNQLIVGFGEIGKAVHEAICPDAFTYDINDDLSPSELDQRPSLKDLDILHVCIPYTGNFVEDVKEYIELLKPRHVIIYSTVPIGTCQSISDKVVHSFVEGRHPYLAESIRKSRRWVGSDNGDVARFFVDYFRNRDLDTIYVSTKTSELVKLRSTAKYGINLVWAQYEAELCEKFGVAYTDVMQFDEDYNKTYEDEDYINRYILYPPNGRISGHCIVPNAKLLNEQFPSEFLDKIIEMGAK